MAKTVANVMTCDLLTVHPETPLQEAIQLLAKNRISGLPVVAQDGKLAGILSESDLMWQATGAPLPAYIMLLDSVIYLKNPARYSEEVHKALGQTVGEVMSHDKPVTIQPDASLRYAAQLMHSKKVTRLPVVDETGALVGILTQGDIVRAMAESYQDETAELAL
ncbi:MAG: CBS domain-containing protein [Leptolyngbya sp. SIO1D8]|nr:CBS domain-containing protein [Leptolyngbya sp. SIO1D8]